MKVFALYRPELAEFIPAWIKSWTAHGWTPQIITEREVKIYGGAKQALKARGGRLLIGLNVINFSYRCPKKYPKKLDICEACRPGWETAPLLKFGTLWTLLNFGRKL